MDKEIRGNLPAMIEAIRKIKRDCLSLEKRGELTEHGKGQLDLIRTISEELGLD